MHRAKVALLCSLQPKKEKRVKQAWMSTFLALTWTGMLILAIKAGHMWIADDAIPYKELYELKILLYLAATVGFVIWIRVLHSFRRAGYATERRWPWRQIDKHRMKRLPRQKPR